MVGPIDAHAAIIINMFEHDFLNFPIYPRIEENGIRYYDTPAGKFKSVTTILGERLDKSGLERWKARVGEDEAKKISTQASNRGTAIHEIAEKYVLNDPNYKRGIMPFNLVTFNSIKPILDKHVEKVYGIESTLYSAKLQAAGTCDMLAVFSGENTIVDYKTSKRIKKKKDIESYFLQTAAYSWCAREMTGIDFPQIAIIMAVDHEDPILFIEKSENYYDRMLEVFCR